MRFYSPIGLFAPKICCKGKYFSTMLNAFCTKIAHLCNMCRCKDAFFVSNYINILSFLAIEYGEVTIIE